MTNETFKRLAFNEREIFGNSVNVYKINSVSAFVILSNSNVYLKLKKSEIHVKIILFFTQKMSFALFADAKGVEIVVLKKDIIF